MSLIKLAFNKEAGIWDGAAKGLWAGAKTLMGNKVIRNAIAGAGIGAVTGAATAESGQGMSGALKGAGIGALAGGGATYGKQLLGNYKALGNNATVGAALKVTGDAGIGNTASNAMKAFKNQRSIAQGLGSTLPTLGMKPPPAIAQRTLGNTPDIAASTISRTKSTIFPNGSVGIMKY